MSPRKPIATHRPPPRAREWLRACLQEYLSEQRVSKWQSAEHATSALTGHLASRAQLTEDESDELLAILNGQTLEAWRASIAVGMAARARAQSWEVSYEPATIDGIGGAHVTVTAPESSPLGPRQRYAPFGVLPPDEGMPPENWLGSYAAAHVPQCVWDTLAAAARAGAAGKSGLEFVADPDAT